LLDLQRYLVREGQAPNRLLGEEVNFSVDGARYEPKVTWTFTPQPDVASDVKPEAEKDEAVMSKDAARLNFSLKDAATHRPGVFVLTLTHVGDTPPEDRQEKRSYAYNVDALAESNLKRATSDRLLDESLTSISAKEGVGRLQLHVADVSDYSILSEKQP